MIEDPPGGNYFEAILIAIRGAGQRTASATGYLNSAEKAALPTWKWQLLHAAERDHAEAKARLDEAEERLSQLGGKGGLPAPLDQLPERLRTLRADLCAAGDRIQDAFSKAILGSAGEA